MLWPHSGSLLARLWESLKGVTLGGSFLLAANLVFPLAFRPAGWVALLCLPMDALAAPAGLLAAAVLQYELVLFVAGTNALSVRALRSLERICAQHLAGRYSLTIVNVAQDPARAVAEQLLDMPCLLKKRPGRVRRRVGNFSDEARVLKLK